MTYRFLAYRRLSRSEMVFGVRQFLAQPRVRRRKKRDRNKVITILTIHGASPGL
ncbi:MAG: hypothetical protein ACRELE_05410 [Gemmatimonadales bacterium]